MKKEYPNITHTHRTLKCNEKKKLVRNFNREKKILSRQIVPKIQKKSKEQEQERAREIRIEYDVKTVAENLIM